MPKIIPLNDYVLVELLGKYADTGLKEAGKDEYASIQKGLCIDVGEALYRSKGNWVLDEVAQAQVFTSSELRQEFLNQLTIAKKKLIGSILYWEMYADKDTTFEITPGKPVALVKLAQICAMEVADDPPNDGDPATIEPAPDQPKTESVAPAQPVEPAKPTEAKEPK